MAILIAHVQAIEGQIAIHLRARIQAVESVGCDPHNVGRLTVETDLFADRAWIAAESLLPVGVSQYDCQVPLRSLAFTWPEQATGGWVDSESQEVIAADGGVHNLCHLVIPAQTA